jgi:hypothetical protein
MVVLSSAGTSWWELRLTGRRALRSPWLAIVSWLATVQRGARTSRR